MLISDQYRDINRKLHRDRQSYGASGHKWADIIGLLCAIRNSYSVLDYGAGKGTLKDKLPYVTEYDPCVEGKEEEPIAHDIVVCTDVLEHIEPDHLNEVLRHIWNRTLYCALLVAATRPANKTLPDGRNAHLIVEDKLWWENKLNQYFALIELAPTQEDEYVVLAIPRSKP